MKKILTLVSLFLLCTHSYAFKFNPFLSASNLTGTLGVTYGGTGTSTQFTQGSVVFTGASGIYSQNNSQLFWDNSSNRLGIGTTTPVQKLDIVGTANVSKAIFIGTTPNSWNTLYPIGLGLGAYICGADANTQLSLINNARYQSGWKYVSSNKAALLNIGESNDGAFRFYTAPVGVVGATFNFTQAMILNSSGLTVSLNSLYVSMATGRVGIGTTTPLNTFSVGASSQFQITSTGSISTIAEMQPTLNMTRNGLWLHTVNLGSTFSRLKIYGTATDYFIQSSQGGAITALPITLRHSDSGINTDFKIWRGASTTLFALSTGATGLSTQTSIINLSGANFTGAAVNQSFFSMTGTLTQTSSSTYNGILMNFTETSIGSGINAFFKAQIGGTTKFIVSRTGAVGIGTNVSPNAMLDLPAGTATQKTAPLKFTNGVDVTVPVDGLMQWSTSTSTAPTFTFGGVKQSFCFVNVTQNITNKRITARVVPMADATSFTPSGNITDIATQVNTQAIGTLTANPPSGTPQDGQGLEIRIKSTNVQTFSWNAIYRGGTVANPTATTGSSKTDRFWFEYNSTDSKWDFIQAVYGN